MHHPASKKGQNPSQTKTVKNPIMDVIKAYNIPRPSSRSTVFDDYWERRLPACLRIVYGYETKSLLSGWTCKSTEIDDSGGKILP